MQKSKLGISVGLFGALIYVMGLINTLGLIVMVGYVLLVEEELWLKKSAVKAVIITIGFSLLSVLISSGNDVFGILNTILGWVRLPFSFPSFQFAYPFGLEVILRNLLSLAETLLMLILAFVSLKQKSVKLGPIDDIINKNMD